MLTERNEILLGILMKQISTQTAGHSPFIIKRDLGPVKPTLMMLMTARTLP